MQASYRVYPDARELSLARLIVVLFLALLGTFLLPASRNRARSQEVAAGVEPILRLEKPKYVLGEAIRFWVGAEPRNSAVIPQTLRKPCSLAITRPDGTTETQPVGWPIRTLEVVECAEGGTP
jgi:hypothetical protein